MIDGLTGVQRVFFGWAQVWRTKSRDAEAIRRLAIDPHSPPEFRCNGVIRNLDAFYEAFEVERVRRAVPRTAAPGADLELGHLRWTSCRRVDGNCALHQRRFGEGDGVAQHVVDLPEGSGDLRVGQ